MGFNNLQSYNKIKQILRTKLNNKMLLGQQIMFLKTHSNNLFKKKNSKLATIFYKAKRLLYLFKA